MSSPDFEQIKKMVADLDAAVPREDARVRLSQYGAIPLESEVVANQLGYLRLGIEFLGAAFAPPMRTSKKKIYVELRYLQTLDSSVVFDRFERREDLPLGTPPPRPLISPLPAILTLVLAACLVLVFIGARTAISWIHH
jgi:hypothetical protein